MRTPEGSFTEEETIGPIFEAAMWARNQVGTK
jgi:hypothetical protein